MISHQESRPFRRTKNKATHFDLYRESIEYMESVFRLLRTYPETLMNYNVHMNQRGASASGDCSTQNKKKRKLAVDRGECDGALS